MKNIKDIGNTYLKLAPIGRFATKLALKKPASNFNIGINATIIPFNVAMIFLQYLFIKLSNPDVASKSGKLDNSCCSPNCQKNKIIPKNIIIIAREKYIQYFFSLIFLNSKAKSNININVKDIAMINA